MTRTVYNAPFIAGASNTDIGETFNFLNLSGGNVGFRTCWMNGAVTDGLPLIGIRSDSGRLGFIGEKNNISPPPGEYDQLITSTDSSDSSSVNFIILPYQNQHRGFDLSTYTIGLLALRGNGLGNGNFGTATLSGGTVTINTTYVSSSSAIFVCNSTTPAAGPSGSFGNVYVSNVVSGTSFTITSANNSASNPVTWFIVNHPQLTGNGTAFANVVLDRTAGTTQNYGTYTLTGGSTPFVKSHPGITSNTLVFASTITPDTNPANRGYLLPLADSTTGDVVVWSSVGADTQTFAWWLMETAGGFP